MSVVSPSGEDAAVQLKAKAETAGAEFVELREAGAKWERVSAAAYAAHDAYATFAAYLDERAIEETLHLPAIPPMVYAELAAAADKRASTDDDLGVREVITRGVNRVCRGPYCLQLAKQTLLVFTLLALVTATVFGFFMLVNEPRNANRAAGAVGGLGFLGAVGYLNTVVEILSIHVSSRASYAIQASNARAAAAAYKQIGRHNQA